MHKIKLLTAGAWILALLVGVFAWLSPDSKLFPHPVIGLAVAGAGLLLLLLWAIAVGFRRDAPHPSFARHLGAITPLLATVLALALAAHGFLPYAPLPLLLILGIGLAASQVSRRLAGEPMGRVGEFAIAMMVIASLLVVVPALGLAVCGGHLWAMTDVDLSRPLGRIAATAVLDRYRAAVRPAISPDGAGMALQALADAGGAPPDLHLIEIPGTQGRPWLPDSGSFARWSGDSLLRYAQHGLKGDERLLLTRLASHPGLGGFDSVAYAAELDPWAALRMPLPTEMTLAELPLPRVIGIRDAARARLYGAVLLSTSNHHPQADSVMRSVIAFGLRLRDDSDLLIGAVIGATIAREAGLTMAAQWRAEGRTLMADSLSGALLDSTLNAPKGAPGMPTTRAALLAAIRDTGQLRALRWEHLVRLGLARCTDLREFLYGSSTTVREAYASAAPSFSRTPQEQAAFEVMARGISGREGEWHLPLLLRPAGWVLGERGVGCGQVAVG